MKKILFTLALLISFSSFGQTAEEYFKRAFSKASVNDDYGAISDFNKAIELNPNYAVVYNNRGIAKYYNKDLKGACEDGKKSASLGYDAYQLIQAACN
tara:strand:- start:579 stop:872 length:294 start_codon:yes stop_codon:yes gene_type:complete